MCICTVLMEMHQWSLCPTRSWTEALISAIRNLSLYSLSPPFPLFLFLSLLTPSTTATIMVLMHSYHSHANAHHGK